MMSFKGKNSLVCRVCSFQNTANMSLFSNASKLTADLLDSVLGKVAKLEKNPSY